MKWFLMIIGQWLITLLAFIVNPIVVLFANEEGELPHWLRGFQTWDNSLDAEQEVVDEAGKLRKYDWHSKYYNVEVPLEGTGRTRIYTKLKDGATFTLRERFQRYLCRVFWIYRNPAYGFAFYTFGREVDCDKVTWLALEDSYRYAKDDKSLWDKTWVIKDSRYITDTIKKSWYFGWKIPANTKGKVRCMIAGRIAIRFNR